MKLKNEEPNLLVENFRPAEEIIAPASNIRKAPKTARKRYCLTELEREWCYRLMNAVRTAEVKDGLPNNDFLIAQYAIITKGNAQQALSRMKKTADFLKTYKLDEIGDDEVIQWYTERLDGIVFRSSNNDSEGRPTMSMNYGKFFPKQIIKAEDNLRYLLKSFYLILEACNTDFHEMRMGCNFIGNCAGLGFANFSEQLERTFARLYQDSYPVRFHGMYMVDSPILIKVLLKICSVFLKKKLRERIRLLSMEELRESGMYGAKGCNLSSAWGGTIDESFVDW
eukprot:CAMPEP_0206400322 /NCGR_PEP_ID=MMETSP0294-20121207/25452_1 /ASSEMBLY_ACC=CAM_ASM_000327 /TAXON_ID=39354 /ORGANISM="Heterosigma akashiwo, Strain CCMP2393" /LENGTH=281 /DNA_ID=CAMNT_0053856503 /DNA_START=1 /DNA_END=843 /DNA_ORIENTATION=-